MLPSQFVAHGPSSSQLASELHCGSMQCLWRCVVSLVFHVVGDASFAANCGWCHAARLAGMMHLLEVN